MIKILRAAKTYKDANDMVKDPREGVGAFVYGFFQPVIVIVSILTAILCIGGAILLWGVGMKFMAPVFWVSLIVFVLVQVVGWLLRKILRSASHAVVGEAQKAYHHARQKYFNKKS